MSRENSTDPKEELDTGEQSQLITGKEAKARHGQEKVSWSKIREPQLDMAEESQLIPVKKIPELDMGREKSEEASARQVRQGRE
jgi:hypothetical protein